MSFLLGSANSAATDTYEITNSLRFSADTDLKRLPSATGQSIKGTLSVWVKFGTQDTEMAIIGGFDNSGGNDNDGYFVFKRLADGNLQFEGGDNVYLETTAHFRDCTAWYHIVLAIDSGNSTANNKQRIYVNGAEITAFDTRNNLTNLQDLPMNTTAGNDDALLIGCDEDTGGKGLFFDGYMSEFYWIDQNQYAASDFGEYNGDGIWVPKEFAGSFGVNGVFLQFKQTGTGADASGMGADTGGGAKHFTVTNLTAVDVCVDTPTNNFSTMSPHYKSTDGVDGNKPIITEGMTKVTNHASGDCSTLSTIGVANGKWYFEAKFEKTPSDVQGHPIIGWAKNGNIMDGDHVGINTASGTNYRGRVGVPVIANAFDGVPGAGDIVGFYLDIDNGTLILHLNGSDFMGSGASSGLDFSSTTFNVDTGFFQVRYYSGSNVAHFIEFNFGNPNFALSSAVSDANGYGDFEYNPTLGGTDYYAVCTKNLAEFG